MYPLSSQSPVSTPDLLASLLARVVSLFFPVSDVDIAAASRQFSLILVGAIILSSVRRALGGVTRVSHLVPVIASQSLILDAACQFRHSNSQARTSLLHY